MSEAAPVTIAADGLIKANLIVPKSPSVILTSMDNRILLFLAAAAQVHQAMFHKPLIVTSGRDDAHAAHSKHYEGKAVDLGLHDIEAWEQAFWNSACTYVAMRTGCGIFYEFPGTPEEHYHIETNT